jgi:hypothetical protein
VVSEGNRLTDGHGTVSIFADIVVGNVGSGDGNNVISVLLGNGDGTFQSARYYGAGANPEAVAVADFNRDGYPDVAVSNGTILINAADWGR